MKDDLNKRFEELVDTIEQYESDTFSAESSRLTREEAETIALEFVLRDLDKRIRCETMDGDMITEQLAIIRE